MNTLQVAFRKLEKVVTKQCLKKHKECDSVTVSIVDYGRGLQVTVHVWLRNDITHSYYLDTVRPKQVLQYIRHNDGV